MQTRLLLFLSNQLTHRKMLGDDDAPKISTSDGRNKKRRILIFTKEKYMLKSDGTGHLGTFLARDMSRPG